jgi:predicted Zn-dependent protease
MCIAVLAAGSQFVPPAFAHMEVHEQIRAMDRMIEAQPNDPKLYLRRGELHRIHQDWALAKKDYLKARKLEPDLAAVDFCMGRMKLEAGKPAEAKRYLDRFLRRLPNDPKGRQVRGETLVELGQPLAAAEDFTVALDNAVQGTPRPEIYIARARALVSAGPEYLDRALSGLDEGLQTIGWPVTLDLYALELEIKAKRFDDALSRLDRLAANSTRKEPWLMRKGAVLEAAGRNGEATQVFQQALKAIDTLPRHRRGTRAVKRMEDEAAAALERLNIAESTSK